jgi:hypothetical protein
MGPAVKVTACTAPSLSVACLFRVSVERMLCGRGDMLDDFPDRRYPILGNFINQAQRGSHLLDLRFEFYYPLMCAR